jgi:hypothetical protein
MWRFRSCTAEHQFTQPYSFLGTRSANPMSIKSTSTLGIIIQEDTFLALDQPLRVANVIERRYCLHNNVKPLFQV